MQLTVCQFYANSKPLRVGCLFLTHSALSVSPILSDNLSSPCHQITKFDSSFTTDNLQAPFPWISQTIENIKVRSQSVFTCSLNYVHSVCIFFSHFCMCCNRLQFQLLMTLTPSGNPDEVELKQLFINLTNSLHLTRPVCMIGEVSSTL